MAMAVRFGTDGIRGKAYETITVDLAYRLGRAVGTVFDAPVFVGYDTRESSPVLTAAVLAGVTSVGGQATNLGVFTTPGVAVIAQRRGGVGIVVSASHNPYYDNGLKVLGLGGTKLDLPTEEAVTDALNAAPSPLSEDFPEVAIDLEAQHDYAQHLRAIVPTDLSALTIVLDCANGASSSVAHELFEATGARVITLHDQPTGHNINEACGSTHPDDLVAAVVAHGADLGLAFDGDADRLIAVDANGTIRDGDDLMVLFALDSATIRQSGVVVTSMSNLGLRRAMHQHGIALVETDVGDRHVLMALEERDWSFGGEQSGHLIFRDLSPTGDGLLTGLRLAELVARRGALATLADEAWRRVPQALINVPHEDYEDTGVRSLFAALQRQHALGDDDVRLLIRPSGTEPVVRIMVEASNGSFVDDFVIALGRHFSV